MLGACIRNAPPSQCRIAAIPGGRNPPALAGFRWFESNRWHNFLWGRSSVWIEHRTVTSEVTGSNPVGPATILG